MSRANESRVFSRTNSGVEINGDASAFITGLGEAVGSDDESASSGQTGSVNSKGDGRASLVIDTLSRYDDNGAAGLSTILGEAENGGAALGDVREAASGEDGSTTGEGVFEVIAAPDGSATGGIEGRSRGNTDEGFGRLNAGGRTSGLARLFGNGTFGGVGGAFDKPHDGLSTGFINLFSDGEDEMK